MCSRAKIAFSTWNACQLIESFNSLLAASTCCYRSRHRCDTVIHVCLQPTRGLSLKANLNVCVRPSGARPQHIAKDCCCGLAHYLVQLLITVAWYSTWSLSFGACTATRMQLEGRNVPCKQYCCASGLQQHLIICTEDVTAARRTLQRLHTDRYFLGTRRLRLPRRVTLERVPTDSYFLFSACGVDMLPPRPSTLQLVIRWEFKPFSNKRFLILCASC